MVATLTVLPAVSQNKDSLATKNRGYVTKVNYNKNPECTIMQTVWKCKLICKVILIIITWSFIGLISFIGLRVSVYEALENLVFTSI